MKVSTHLVSTSIICLILLVVTDWYNAILFFIGGVGVDVDHYLLYVLRKDDWSLAKAYKWYVELGNKIKANPLKYICLHWFHTIEFLFLLLVASYFLDNFYFLFFGVCSHLLLDITSGFYYKIVGVRKLSALQYLFIKAEDKKDKIII